MSHENLKANGLPKTHNPFPPVWWNAPGVAVCETGCGANSLEGTVAVHGEGFLVEGWGIPVL